MIYRQMMSLVFAATSLAAASIPTHAASIAALSNAASPAESTVEGHQTCDTLSKAAEAGGFVLETLVGNYHTDSEYSPRGNKNLTIKLARHCELTGTLDRFQSDIGETFAIGFRLRLPDTWNGKFLFMGGGGSNGRIGAAVGDVGVDDDVALNQGYAVFSQDSGHDNSVNNLPDNGGIYSFGLDPHSRQNYAYASLQRSYRVAQSLIQQYYHNEPEFNYFYGCSKGGQEGLAFAELYPQNFDGIVAGAPGMSLPKAAIAEAWDINAIAKVAIADGKEKQNLTPVDIANTFTETNLQKVTEAVLQVCDALDGAKDGLVNAYLQCTSARVIPELESKLCSRDKSAGCLSVVQLEALTMIIGGPKNSLGQPLYTHFAWDAGLADPGWKYWKLGDATHAARNIYLGASSLSAVFSVPAVPPPADETQLLQWQLRFDFDKDANAIFATNERFVRSGWSELNMRFADMSGFSKHGKLIVPHGVSDPVFSVNDTLAWWDQFNLKYHNKAAEFVRVFPVPGMGHCRGGPAPSNLNAFSAMVNWVEKDVAPDFLEGKTAPDSQWQGQSFPVCAYPSYASATNGKTAKYSCTRPDKQ